MDWKKLDREYKYSYREDRLKAAKLLGFNYISECTVSLYNTLQSTRRVADMLKLSPTAVAVELKKHGIKLRSRGGNNYTGKRYRQHWNPLSTNTRAPLSRPE
jgi:hypothetical protein